MTFPLSIDPEVVCHPTLGLPSLVLNNRELALAAHTKEADRERPKCKNYRYTGNGDIYSLCDNLIFNECTRKRKLFLCIT